MEAVIEAEQLATTNVLADNAQPLWRPPPKLSLSEWADQYRILSSESSAEPGQWVTARAPYEKEIMNAISDPDVPRVVVQKASQMGISDCILNAVGYYMDQDPCPIMVVQPTIEVGESFSVDRVRPMLRDTPRLRGLVVWSIAREPAPDDIRRGKRRRGDGPPGQGEQCGSVRSLDDVVDRALLRLV
jgi:phage terminase large subunit GpA-like protein